MVVVLWVVVALWALGEIGLQLTQLLRSKRTKTREWGSYGGIAVTAALAVVAASLLRRALPALDFFPLREPGWLLAATILIALGAAFRLWSIATLGRYFRAVVHIQEDHHVVRSGPYRVLRHPSYTGLLVVTLGLALLLGNYASTVVFELLVIVGMLYRIHVEERMLLDGLGEDYAAYMRETRRLIPGVW
jgi:protein-S-isoprenylcysteine O-methyltransferase Ste14